MEKLRTALIFLTISYIFMANPTAYAENISDNNAKISWFDDICQGKENLAMLHFYVQNIGSGPNATVFTVATASITPDSPTGFGQVFVVDDKLTTGPELDSGEVGRVQGITANADMQTRAISQIFNFFFTSGKYNGSTITVVGRNQVGDEQRELPVVGGTGVFRFARGYALSTTYLNDDVADRMVLEYTVYLTYTKTVTLRVY